MTNTEPTATTEEPPVRILKIANCPSLSGRSTLTYHIGCKNCVAGTEGPPDTEIHFRVFTNTAKGFFSNEWVSTRAIQKAFESIAVNDPITSAHLVPIFNGKSVNTAGFLFAVLKAEGLVVAMMDKRRYYERASAESFVAEITFLMEAQVNLDPSTKPGTPSKPGKHAVHARQEKKARQT